MIMQKKSFSITSNVIFFFHLGILCNLNYRNWKQSQCFFFATVKTRPGRFCKRIMSENSARSFYALFFRMPRQISQRLVRISLALLRYKGAVNIKALMSRRPRSMECKISKGSLVETRGTKTNPTRASSMS